MKIMDCFVIMPFGDPSVNREQFDKLDDIYSECIKPTIESIPRTDGSPGCLTCHRADKQLGPGDIVEHVIESLIDARIVIADLTGRNANVFYELGIRHAISTSTILIVEGTEHIPFDIRTLRAIVYEYTPRGMRRFASQLWDTVQSILSSSKIVDNPVRRTIHLREATRLSGTVDSEVFDIVRSLTSELSTLKADLRAQHKEMATLVSDLTAQPLRLSAEAPPEMGAFEGVWHNYESESTYCMRVIDGELRVPYSYNGRELTGHFYNCRAVGALLLCRFDWLSRRLINGSAALRLITPTILQGGWCFSMDPSARRGKRVKVHTAVSPDDPKLTRMVLQKHPDPEFPKWATDYFSRYGT